MKKITLSIALLAIVLLAIPAQAQKLQDAYLDINKKTFKRDFQHLAMMPIVSAPSLNLPDDIKQLIADEVLKKFSKSRIQILSPQEVKAIQDQLTSLYPGDSWRDSIDVIGDHTARELFFRYPVNGLLSVQVLAVAAPFADDKAEWAGTSQKIQHQGDGFLGAIMGKDYGGYVAASSIRVVISDRSGKPVYNWSGGIEVLMQRNGQKLEVLPASSMWQNRKRVLKAVNYALKPI